MAHTSQFLVLTRALYRARRENLQQAGETAPVAVAGTMTRRGFLRATTVATAAVALAGAVRPETARAAGGAGRTRVAVVGGGLAGLNAAYRLSRQGLDVRLYEGRRRLGGRVQSVTTRDGFVLDRGGSFVNSDHEDMLALVREFDLELFDRARDSASAPHPETRYFLDGRAIPEEEVAQALRPLAGRITRDADRLDGDYDTYAPRFDRLSVSEYLDGEQDAIPEAWVRTLVEQTIRTEYGVEPQESSALQLLFVLPTVDGRRVELLGNSDEAYTVQGGSQQVPDALGRALGDRVELGHVLRRIEEHGDGFRLTFLLGKEVEADHVVLAIPFTVLRHVELQVSLPSRLRRFIDEGDLGHNEKVFVAFADRLWRRPDGFTGELWTDLSFASAWDATQQQGDRPDGVLTLYTGGEQVNRLPALGARAARQLVRELEGPLPGATAAATGWAHRTRWSLDPFTRGAYSSYRPGQLTQFGSYFWIDAEDQAERQEVTVGNLVFAGEHLSDAYYGYMNGAAETGRLAADAVLRAAAATAPAAVAPESSTAAAS